MHEKPWPHSFPDDRQARRQSNQRAAWAGVLQPNREIRRGGQTPEEVIARKRLLKQGMKTIGTHAMIQENAYSNNIDGAGQEPFAGQKRCLITLWDTLSKVNPEVSNGTLQEILAVLRYVASTLSFHSSASVLLNRQVLSNVESGCTILQRATEILTQPNYALDERTLLITNCRSCIAEAIKYWPQHLHANIQ